MKDQERMDEDLWGVEEDEDTQANKYLSFRIGKESYGISIRLIIEIIEMQKIIEMPDVPDFVKGIINLRGKIIPVIDLRLRFHFEGRPYDDRTCVIVIEVSGNYIGLIVDTVEEVVEITEKNIEHPPHFKGDKARDRYISGLGKIGDSVKILLDVNKILYDEDIKSITEELEKIS